MKSVKLGQGPSRFGIFLGVIFGLVGVVWTVATIVMGAPFLAVFGVVFVIIVITGIVFNYQNATGSQRMSLYDITDEGTEDPEQLSNVEKSVKNNTSRIDRSGDIKFCPYCGTEVAADFVYCPKCGKAIPG